MIVCVDVDYRDDGEAGKTRAVAACVELSAWTSPRPFDEHVCLIEDVADYVPGQFYRRELPCVLAVLDTVEEPVDLVVVDGYVYLDEAGSPGMGAYLYEALDRRVPIVGVAKNPFRTATGAVEILRGTSARPLYVSAAGIAPELAADKVRSMYGRFRFPDMLKRVDRLCRDARVIG